MKTFPALFLTLALMLCALSLRAGVAVDGSVFGSRDSGESGLIGIIYDLKQTQKREPTEIGPGQYAGVIREFLQKGWDESVLNHYFRAARPLYTTQIFIPMMGANAAPKAFGMENVIKPSVWVVHYKGQVSPPEDGTYRFLCYADDMIAVAVNGKTVCQGSRRDMHLDEVWKSPEKRDGPRSGNGSLTFGDWIDMKKDSPVDLDVIVGERPGGDFCAFLLYQKQGVDYPEQDGQTLYPVFQLASHETPVYPRGDAPAFLKESTVWKGVQ